VQQYLTGQRAATASSKIGPDHHARNLGNEYRRLVAQETVNKTW
jgi:hypothetical protein